MTCFEKWNIVINIVIAAGTIGAVIFALFGEWIKNRFIRAKLSAEIIDPKGELTTWSNGTRVIYYHLRIRNRRPSILVRKCRVLLREIFKKNEDNTFSKLQLAVPPTLQWSPAESSPQTIDFISDQVLDFGFITENSDTFSPAINPRWNNFKGYVKRNETFRFVIELISNNSKPKIIQVEVFWNGTWNANLDLMIDALRIRIL